MQDPYPTKKWDVVQSTASEWLSTLPDGWADAALFSPPYPRARTYDNKLDIETDEWVEFWRKVIVECCRVARLVFVNCSDVVEGFRYGGGPEHLFADLTRLDGIVAHRPYVWVKSGPRWDCKPNGAPGSGGKHFHRNDYEMIYCYALPEHLGPKRPPRWTNNIAFGMPPEHHAGGQPSMRGRNGMRATEKLKITQRLGRGKDTKRTKEYAPPKISNPGNVLRVRVGGNHLGTKIAHEGEAPMAMGVAERIVNWFVPPGGVIIDPCCGTGSTINAGILHGRRAFGCDMRMSQVKITKRRMKAVTPDMYATVAKQG